MIFVQWKSAIGVMCKVHQASDRVRTLCNLKISDRATFSPKPPRDKTELCTKCQIVDEEQRPFQPLIEETRKKTPAKPRRRSK